VGAEAAELLIRAAEFDARVDPAVLTPQPLAVDQVRACELRPERRAAEPGDRLEIEGLGVLVPAHQCPRARHDSKSPVGATRAWGLDKSLEALRGKARVPATHAGLDQLCQSPVGDEELRRGIARLPG